MATFSEARDADITRHDGIDLDFILLLSLSLYSAQNCMNKLYELYEL